MVLEMALFMASIDVRMPTNAVIPIAMIEAVIVALTLCDFSEPKP